MSREEKDQKLADAYVKRCEDRIWALARKITSMESVKPVFASLKSIIADFHEGGQIAERKRVMEVFEERMTEKRNHRSDCKAKKYGIRNADGRFHCDCYWIKIFEFLKDTSEESQDSHGSTVPPVNEKDYVTDQYTQGRIYQLETALVQIRSFVKVARSDELGRLVTDTCNNNLEDKEAREHRRLSKETSRLQDLNRAAKEVKGIMGNILAETNPDRREEMLDKAHCLLASTTLPDGPPCEMPTVTPLGAGDKTNS